MRIGEINQDNYALFARMFGAKDTKALDKIWGKDKKTAANQTDYSFEAQEAYMISIGYATEGMMVREGDESWKKIVNVPDDVKQAIINKRRESILETANGTLTAESGDGEAAIIRNYYMTLSPSERLSASWTLQKIAQAEGGRISDYIKSQIPGWQPGQAFDRRILTETNYGLGKGSVDLKA